MIHILWTKADEYIDLWCPYCDEVLPFGKQDYYEDVWCTKCKRRFPYEHQWPKGFDIKTGELIKSHNNVMHADLAGLLKEENDHD